ncbi:MAG: 50S ribosomal protein L4 [Chloroflexi bacterium]|jgi:large subunit ribosomal protein L4|uniref:Large ribosomal subunit protein uL4 n=1 Tax=Candidatus Thermofonsia Clade 3 bacterium TaxID=2364212 RepID=A0A2M8QD46_9CHLR|nr:50S ribosomal protein L4 [Candidatus Roseilinea sp. NK_OTU-006]PJF47729.1 MAG: 50S ribosomal protein L4 [Candidatus Thermofonsia Clade 3 bacterium]RMG61798.1 MAG: 50S ribosomal protein L4 [Chloroflexota bacterium]
MKVPVKNLKGEPVGEVELPDRIFAARISQPLMHQALLRQNANAHLGTHKVKTRGEVNRTTKKIYRQKGTGNARQGSRKAPHWVGGGVAFGPVVRSYRQDMPKKMRRAAIRSALSQKAADQQIVVVDKLEMSAPKTKEFAAAMQALGVTKGLVVLPGRMEAVEKSASNLANVKTLHAGYLNIRDIFKYDQLVMPLDTLKVIEAWLG